MTFDRRAFLTFAAGSALPFAAHAAPRFNHLGAPPALPQVSEALDGVLKQTGVPALGYAAVGANGLMAIDVAGRRRQNVEDYVTQSDSWHIGSNTKAMTAALYARLAEQGKAKWGATLADLFPGVTADPAWKTVKIEDVLAHRSGVSDNGLIDQGWLIKAHTDTRPVAEQRAEFAARLLGHAPTGGAPWGHDPGPNGALEPVDPLHDVADNPPIFGPAGRVHLNLADYAKFAQVFLTGGGGWINRVSLAKLARPWDGKEGYALGWQYYENRGWANGPVLAHEGSNTLWRTMALIAPARPIAYLLVTNCGGEAGQRAVQLMAARLIAQQVDPTETGNAAPPQG